MAERILVIDDEKTIRETLTEVLKDEGYEIEASSNGEDALNMVTEHDFDLAIIDIRMPGMSGIEVMQRILEMSPETLVIIITAYATVETAIEALKKGAHDYLVKPIIFDDIIAKIRSLMRFKRLAVENQLLRQEIERKYDFQNIVGRSPEMKRVYDLIKKVSSTKSNILITGESGTGKEMVARAIHFNSPQRDKSFVPVNCGAIPETLFESELFGHTKGAFTGAIQSKKGLFEMAGGGTLFLDEISEMPLHLQVKLLRAIDEKAILPLGATTPVHVDVRIIAASNRDLTKAMESGEFREDLYYRINVMEIRLPSLNERREDIPPLVNHFMDTYNRELKKSYKGVTNETMKALMNSRWKGHVRELENVIERAMIIGNGDFITLKDLPPNFSGEDQALDFTDNLHEAMKIYEKHHINRVLEKVENNKRVAAETLGLSLSTLYRKLEDLKIDTD